MFDDTRVITLDHLSGDVGTKLWPLEITAIESYSDPGEFNIIALSSAVDLDPQQWLGTRLSFSIKPNQQDRRYFSAHIIQMKALNKTNASQRYYNFKLSSWLYYADICQHSRSFCNKSLIEIVDSILDEYKKNSLSSEINYPLFFKSLPKLTYCVQFNESNLAFLTRLLHQFGIYYWIEYSQDGEVIRFGPNTYQPDINSSAYTMGGYCFSSYYTMEKLSHYFSKTGQFNYRQVVRPLNWPDGLAHSNPYTLLSADLCYNISAERVSLARHNYEFSDANTQSMLNTPMRKRPLLSDSGITEVYQYPANKPISAQQQQAKQMQSSLAMRSQVVAIALGQSVKIQGDAIPYLKANPLTVPIKIIHRAKDYTQLPGTELAHNISLLPREWASFKTYYENEIKSIPYEFTPYHPSSYNKPLHISGHQLALVVGVKSGEVHTDQLARVKLWFSWDENNTEADPELCPWVRVKKSAASENAGHHFMPRVGDEVTVAYVNSNPNEPIIIGCNYHAKTSLPFDISQNKWISGINTENHSLYMSDKPSAEHMILHSEGDLFEMSAAEHTHKVVCNETIDVSGDVLTTIIRNGYHLTANQSIRITSGPSTIEITPSEINLTAVCFDHTTQGGGPLSQLAVVGSNHSCPKHHTTGMEHKGGPILKGSSNVFINGMPVARMGDPLKCKDATDVITEGHANFLVNGKMVACKNHATTHGGKITSGLGAVSAGSDPTLVPIKNSLDQLYIIGVEFDMQAKPHDHYKLYYDQFVLTYSTAEGDAKVRTVPIDPCLPQTVADNVFKGQVGCALKTLTRQCDILSVNNKSQLPHFKAQLDIPESPNSGVKVDKDHQYKIELLYPMIIHDIRFEDAQLLDDDTVTGENNLATADRIDVKNYHQVTDDDITYFKNNGNNVTVFVHGYNVELGEFSKEIDHIDNLRQDDLWGGIKRKLNEVTESGTCHGFSFVKSNHDATIYRDQAIIQSQCAATLPDNIFGNDQNGWYVSEEIGFDNIKAHQRKWYLNSTGSRNWAINMEYNLNVATTKFNPHIKENYKKYTRLVHVTWTGNPSSPLDFLSSVDNALKSADKLASLLKRLKDAGLEVNVIAHSAGNIVLVKALDLLGKNQHKIDHVFLWEAAMPADVFTRSKPKIPGSDCWYMPHAVSGAHKITVLYSQNDNILGPIPTIQPSDIKQSDVNRSKPFLTELVPAYVTTVLGLHSLYHFAIWAGVPVSQLWHFKHQQEVYKHWLTTLDEKYLAPDDLTSQQKYEQVKLAHHFLLPTLNEQITYHKQAYQHLYQGLQEKFKNKAAYLKQVFKQAGWGGHDKVYPSVLDALTLEIDNPGAAMADIHALLSNICPAVELAVAMDEDIVWNYDLENPIYGAGCLLWMLEKLKIPPVKALGYEGLPKNHKTQNLMSSGILNNVRQDKWLWSHSGMKIPTKKLMTNIYEAVIMDHMNGIKHFGEY